ncbi:hypothetical protein VCHC52A1_3703 [Vibrio cholerae HC-52A1]|nr:hypothetical protein VCHC52A1_3703 [Vibrio cholerae HC-52A1]EKL19196.1 hypothetical protein VCHC60A1_3703 [Vibrio cholerae HC-60A1]EKL19633.1 hypothetical protein VCHC59A1_3710 [Vibrio cholerae HC-59A1]EKL94996.1 hypothetical protein VCHC02C1_0257 [Vibrio cholerae HC-02C1]EKM04750.1 hypothetical protein VCHC55B2_3676 [Vibrio cholerae HC-55B2]
MVKNTPIICVTFKLSEKINTPLSVIKSIVIPAIIGEMIDIEFTEYILTVRAKLNI